MIDSPDHGFVPCAHIGHSLGTADQPMIAIPKTEKLAGLRIQPGEHDGKVIGLCPRIDQKHIIESRPQLLAQHPAVLPLVLLDVDGREVHQFGGLVHDHRGYAGVRVSAVHRRDACAEVDVAVALVVEEVLPVAVGHQQGLLVVAGLEVRHVRFAQANGLWVGAPAVRRGLVMALRHVFALAVAGEQAQGGAAVEE